MLKRINFIKNKLITKFLVLYVVVIALPIISLTFYSFNQLKTLNDEKLIQSLENYKQNNIREINNKVLNMVELAELALNKKGLTDYLLSDSELTVEELIFYKNYYVSDMEKIKNANSDILNLRFYVKSNRLLEMWPIVYNERRLKGQEWVEEISNSGKKSLWKAFVDELVISNPANETIPKTTVSYYREVMYGYEHIGFLEVSIEISKFFNSMYSADEFNGEGFSVIKKEEDIYFNEENVFIKQRNLNVMGLESQLFNNTTDTKGNFSIKNNNERLFVSYEYINNFDIYLYNVISTDSYDKQYNEQRNIIVIIGFSLIVILSLLTYSIVGMLLKRLNKVITAMRQVQKGNMEVVIEVEGTDEVSELAYHMKKMLMRIRELIELVLKKQEVTKDAEIKALQTQINAHFIYNTLETIKMMAEIEDQILISDSITSLGRLMRYSMSWANASVMLKDELDYVKNYINLINIRRENIIILNLDIEEPLYKYKILKMSVQPIIENAVRHGIEPCESDNVIKIKAFTADESVCIEISDNGIGMEDEEVIRLQNAVDGIVTTVYNSKGNGIGLRNINERIQIFYGEEYGIKVISMKGCFTKICMKLPKE